MLIEQVKSDLQQKGFDEEAIIFGSPDGMNKPESLSVKTAYKAACAYLGTKPDRISVAVICKLPQIFGIEKKRKSATSTEVKEVQINREARCAIIVDDIFSSGGTAFNAAESLEQAHKEKFKKGIEKYVFLMSHAVWPEGALENIIDSELFKSGKLKIYVSDTVPGAPEKLKIFLEKHENDHALCEKLRECIRICPVGQQIIAGIEAGYTFQPSVSENMSYLLVRAARTLRDRKKGSGHGHHGPQG